MNFTEMFYQALAEPYGAVFEVTNYASVKQQLYQARKYLNDPDLAQIKICQSPINPNHMWLVKPPKKDEVEVTI